MNKMTYDYDLFVIGGGSGGVRAARVAANLNKRVGLAEMDRIGGTCVIRGCIPKKLFFFAGGFADQFEDAKGYGWDVESKFDWKRLVTAKDKEIRRLQKIYTDNLKAADVDIFECRAALESPNEIRLEGQTKKTVSAERILIAVGAKPNIPDNIQGSEHCLVSDDMFELKNLPDRIVINGGGYIAVEFAGIMNSLGVQTTLVYRGDKLLRGFDDDVRDMIHQVYERHNIRIITNQNLNKVERNGDDSYSVRLDDQTVETDEVLLATGRIPQTDGIGLEKVGVEMERGVIKVNEYSRTSVSSVWAVGDVTNRKNLTPVAIHEAMLFCQTEFQDNPKSPDYHSIATAVYSHPEIGTVGLSEEDAKKEYQHLQIFRTKFLGLKNTLSGREDKTLMKIVVNGEDDAVLGCHIVGPAADEMIQALAVAITKGITKQELDETMAVHPTSAEELVTLYEPSYELKNGGRVE